MKIQRALISVSNKSDLIGLARFLKKYEIEIIATGGTAQKLGEAGVPYTPIESITGNPEAFGGRMKTLSFPFLSALLFRRDVPGDVETAAKLGIKPIDLVICNFYPFSDAMKSGASDDALVEEIDIGGPSMVRAAAKNFKHVCVLSSPNQYASFMQEMDSRKGETCLELRREFAVRALTMTADYDTMIAQELSRRFDKGTLRYLRLDKAYPLRYGENPHQEAEFYFAEANDRTIAGAKIVQGKALSYNNLLDADAAHRSASDVFLLKNNQGCAVSIIKHLNPCGLAWAKTSIEALNLAWEGDPISAFGGILCFSSSVDKDIAAWLEDKFIEVIVAPKYSEEALQVFAKKKNLRVLIAQPKLIHKEKMIRSISGGVLVQDEDEGLDTEFNSVTKRAFPNELKLLGQFAIISAKHLKSNAIALAKMGQDESLQLVGAGMGQPNRIDSLKMLAGPRAVAKSALKDCVLASDAFFPFPDIIEVASGMGISYILQPGGSMRDQEVIEACDRSGISMAFTGRRHFRH